MNPPSRENDPDALRSDIDVTRSRMDDTIDALGDRMQPRHLVDEILGFFRRHSDGSDGKLTQVRQKISQGTDAAFHSVVDTVKSNPMPALLIGAGVAWMIYSSRKQSNGLGEYDYSRDIGDGVRYDPDAHIDRPLDYPMSGGTGLASGTGLSESSWDDQGESKLGQMKDAAGQKLSHAGQAAREKLDHLKHAASDRVGAVRQRASEMGHRMKDRTGEAYQRTRERVSTTADQHPLELGLVCLAAGLIAGLAIPTPNAVNRSVGPTADRLRDRTREAGHEMLEKGKRVASAAVDAVKDEAEAQGLTPEHLREKAGAVADRAKEAGRETARKEGLPGAGATGVAGGASSGSSGAMATDPTVARPAL